jgi:hypothetical protein
MSDREMRRAALTGSRNRKSDFNKPDESSETIRELQAASLSRRFAFAHYLAVAVAQLAFAVSR